MTSIINRVIAVAGRLALIFLCGWQAVAAQAQTRPLVTNVLSFNEFYTLAPEEAAAGASVRIPGVILCYDFGWNQLYLFDGKDSAWLSPKPFQTNLQRGMQIELTGRTTMAGTTPAFTNLDLRVTGQGTLPVARKLKISELAAEFGQWVEIAGRVRVAETSSGRVALIVQQEGQMCLVYVMGAIWEGYESLRGCEVEIRGINASRRTGDHLDAAALTAPDREAIRVVRRQEAKEAQAVSSVESVLSRQLGAWTNEPVRMSGTVVSYKPGEFLLFKDVTGSLRAEVVQTTGAQEGQRVEIGGYFSAGREPVLRNAWFEVLPVEALPTGRTSAPDSRVAQEEDGAEIAEAARISKMSREEAAKGYPVRLHGLVTYADPDWRVAFLQDESGAIFVDLDQKGIVGGMNVEVSGITSAGGFAPEVVNTKFRILGTTNLPVPIKADLQDLANGQFDAHWVELQGVVRRMSEQWGHLTLQITTAKGRFKSVVLKQEGETVPNLIGALVDVRGAVTSEMNASGQLTGVILYAPNLSCVSIAEGAPADPFSIPVEKIRSVATFDPTKLAGSRVKVKGTVTMIVPGQAFYVQDDAGGLRISSPPESWLQAADVVEVLGFPAMGGFSPSLEEAMVRKTGAAPLPTALQTSAEAILSHGTNDGSIVQVTGQLVQRVTESARPKIVLQAGSVIFSATLMNPEGSRLSKVKVGSVLEVTGVCVIQAGEEHQAESFRLLVKDPELVRVAQTPPWWTAQNALAALGTAALCGALVWVWSASLRRRVQTQTEVIRRNEQELISVSRRAGMAEVATSVLHNVGNVLNSLNVSAQVATAAVQKSKITGVMRVADLLKQHALDLGTFVTQDRRGRGLPEFLSKLGDHLAKEQKSILEELQSLSANVEHINDIVAMQQNYAKAGGVKETLRAGEIIEDALRMNQSALERHEIRLDRRFDLAKSPQITIERHKMLQILLNLISNAKYACSESGRKDKHLALAVTEERDTVRIICADNGIGIPQENLTRIFSHGFTTRRGGHGFGLHASALAARQMGGRLFAKSDGMGCGAVFTLELPKDIKTK